MTAWLDTIHRLPGLTLDEVDEQAALQTRVDRKYVVRPHTWANVLSSLPRTPSALEIGDVAASATPRRTTTRRAWTASATQYADGPTATRCGPGTTWTPVRSPSR